MEISANGASQLFRWAYLVALIRNYPWFSSGAILFKGDIQGCVIMASDLVILNRKKRSERLSEARKKGTHTKDQWENLKIACGNLCVFCKGKSGLINIEKDHIIPLYQGGSDSIENIQPACAKCNASKGANSTDMRPLDWRDK